MGLALAQVQTVMFFVAVIVQRQDVRLAALAISVAAGVAIMAGFFIRRPRPDANPNVGDGTPA